MTALLPLGLGRRHAWGLRDHPGAGGEPFAYIARHAAGDWGDLCAFDRRQNGLALRHGMRVLSSYGVGEGRVWQ